MDLRQLRHFLAVADLLHFGKAADQLGMTQPPLSQSIRLLEEELGVALFERNKRKVALTEVGAAWLPHARAVVEAGGNLPDIAARLARGEVGTIRLAFVSYAVYRLVPPLLKRFAAACPQVQVVLQEAISSVQVAGLIDGSIDLGIIILPDTPLPPIIRAEPLSSDQLIAAVPAHWVEEGRVSPQGDAISFDELKGEPLILFPRPSAPVLHDLIIEHYRKNGTAPVRGQEAVQMQTIVNLVAEGLGFAVVPAPMRELERKGVVYFRIEGGGPPCETALAWRRDRDLPAITNFLKVALEG